MPQPTISFELFPPKTEKAAQNLQKAIPELLALDPAFMTVTYGAGGTTKGGTFETVTRLARETNLSMGAHLTYVGTTKEALFSYVDRLWENGIKHLVALRGDMPDDLVWPLDTDKEYFQFTSDFVTGLKARHDFDISVGAYPEKHPDAPSLNDDIEALKKKCDAGADRAITQFFFDNEVYYRFKDQVQKAGITTPIIPGILPITDFSNMVSFAKKCGTSVPDWLHQKFEGREEDSKKIAQEIFIAQIKDLIDHGVPHIHFYTLNRADMVKELSKIF